MAVHECPPPFIREHRALNGPSLVALAPVAVRCLIVPRLVAAGWSQFAIDGICYIEHRRRTVLSTCFLVFRKATTMRTLLIAGERPLKRQGEQSGICTKKTTASSLVYPI